MTKKRLLQYRAKKKEREKLLDKIKDIEMTEVPAVLGKVRGSSKNFPYIEVHTPVLMNEPKASDALNLRIKEYKKRLESDEKELLEIEQFISSIDDAETRMILQMAYIDGKRQYDIAWELNIDQSTVSKKIKACLQLS